MQQCMNVTFCFFVFCYKAMGESVNAYHGRLVQDRKEKKEEKNDHELAEVSAENVNG